MILEIGEQPHGAAASDPAAPSRRLLGMPEVAIILGVSLPRAYELARTHVIPSVRLGARQVRVDRIALDLWLLSREQEPADVAAPPGPTIRRARRSLRSGLRA